MHSCSNHAGLGHAGRVKILPYEAAHLLAINEQDAETYWGAVCTPEYARELESAGPAYTAMREDGTVLCCAGIIVHWECRALAWAIMARSIGPDYVAVHRAVERFLNSVTTPRIEITVDCEFPAAIRWAKLLGFECEARMKCYAPGGRDHYLYARVQ